MHIIIGLGNPGRDYQNTLHNMGFMALDILAQRWDIEIRRHHHRAVFGEGFINGHKVVLAKPDTYMNNSGWAVRDLMNWYKCAPEELIVIYDDSDIEPGTIRIRENGSAGTHNGMKSIIYQLGYDNFARVRVGIGQRPPEWDLADYVLSMPPKDAVEPLKKALNEAADTVELFVRGEIREAQDRYNKRPKKVKAPKEEETGKSEECTDISTNANNTEEA